MKKLLILLLVCVMLFSSCGTGVETTTPKETTNDPFAGYPTPPPSDDTDQTPKLHTTYRFVGLQEFQDVMLDPAGNSDHYIYTEKSAHVWEPHLEMMRYVENEKKLHVPALNGEPLVAEEIVEWNLTGWTNHFPEIQYSDDESGIWITVTYLDAFSNIDPLLIEDVLDFSAVLFALYQDGTLMKSWNQAVNLQLADRTVRAFRSFNDSSNPLLSIDQYIFVYDRMLVYVSAKEEISQEAFLSKLSFLEVSK